LTIKFARHTPDRSGIRLADLMGLEPAHRTPTLARRVPQQVFSQALIKITAL